MEEKFCQSCGMPLNSNEQYGTNADGTLNQDYCSYCYKNGAFTNENMTMEEMMEINLSYIDVYNKESGQSMSKEEARPQLEQFLQTLKRWKK